MIDLLMFAYREVSCETTGFSPFELIYGRTARGSLQVVKEELTYQAVYGKRQSGVKYLLDLRKRLKQGSELASEHAMTLQVKMKTYCDKNTRQRSLAADQRVLILFPESNNSLLCNWKGMYTVLRKVNDTNYEADLGQRMTCLHINLLKLWNERENEAPVNVVIGEEEVDVKQFRLSLVGDVERDSREFIVGDWLTVQQRGQLLDILEEHNTRIHLPRKWKGQIVSVINTTERRCSIYKTNVRSS